LRKRRKLAARPRVHAEPRIRCANGNRGKPTQDITATFNREHFSGISRRARRVSACRLGCTAADQINWFGCSTAVVAEPAGLGIYLLCFPGRRNPLWSLPSAALVAGGRFSRLERNQPYNS